MAGQDEIAALISLLDDSDSEVFEHVFGKLAAYGPDIIPTLETAWSETFNATLNERIEELIHHIQFGELSQEFNLYAARNEFDLLEGAILLARYQFPELDEDAVRNQIDDIRRDIWLELHQNLTPIEQVNVFNQIFYGHYKFGGNIAQTQDPRYYCVNQVVETKKGNSLSLGILYLILAAQLDLPIFGVNLPRHFILSYYKHDEPEYNDDQKLRQNVIFYINPLNKGAIFTRNEIKDYLKQSQIGEQTSFFVPCRNQRILEILLKQMIELYRSSGNPDKTNELRELLKAVDTDEE